MSFFKAVDQLVENGQFNYGHYNEGIKTLNPLEADFFRTFTPELFKQSRLKEWQIFNITNESFTGLLLLIDLKYVQVIHVSLYDLVKKRFYKKTVTKPPLTFDLLTSLDEGHFFHSEESLFIEIFTKSDLAPLKVNLSFTSDIDQIPVKLLLEGGSVETEPFVYCKPIQKEKAVYSHRMLLPTKGSLMISSVLYPFDINEAQVVIEDYKSFQPYDMNSMWLCAGSLKDELTLCLSMNPYSKESDICENALWYKGKLMPLSNIDVVFSSKGWEINSKDGTLDLLFVPKTLNKLSESYLMLKASCDLPCGELSGKIMLNGETICIDAIQAVGGNIEMKL